MSHENEGSLDSEERERVELFTQIGEVKAKIQQKIAALKAHPNVPQNFKTQLERISGELK